MSNDDFLMLSQKMLYKLRYYDDLTNIGSAQIATNNLDETIWWNNVTFSGDISDKILEIENYFQSRNRKTTFYFAEDGQNIEFEKILRNGSYKQTDYEVWLEVKNPTISKDRFGQIEQIMNMEELGLFIETVDKGFSPDDPDNPYGGLGDEYLDKIRQSFDFCGADGKIKYYIIFSENNEPVGVGCLTNYHNIGYISNLTVLPQFRGQGFSKVLINYLLDLSIKVGNITHCLATEVDSKPDKIYRHLGFVEMFRAKYYTKEKV